LFFIDILEVSGFYWNVFYVLRIGICNTWKEKARKETPHEHMRIIHFPFPYILSHLAVSTLSDIRWDKINNKASFVVKPNFVNANHI
jgi:hypothetical protein